MTRTRTQGKTKAIHTSGLRAVEAWFGERGWKPFDFQHETWAAYAAGASGLIHANTGTGKTYAAYLGPIIEALDEPPTSGLSPLRLLWITPLRALSSDTQRALELPLGPLGLNWDVGCRTGDTSSSQRARQTKRLPSVLVTTPESLALFLTRPDTRERFANLRAVVVDEWHELLSTKRGVLVELGLARLRHWCPKLRVWGLSATLGNLPEAAATLLGPGQTARIVSGEIPKTIVVDTVIPAQMSRFPWAGHLGVSLADQVVAAIDEAQSTLVFTNTRAQAELWYQSILKAKPEWAGLMALHHGSLDRSVRDWVEDQLREGTLRCVVCTSSLDLGVDFSPVDRVLQIGSPKGIARLLQRAGRSGHRPTAVSRVTCVPTNALELIEMAAARDAMTSRRIESRLPCRKPLDVLAQHLVTCALGGGFDSDSLYDEVCTSAAYADLSKEEWNWTLDFVVRGGESLRIYTDFHRVVQDPSGMFTVTSKHVAHRHRLSIGTIVADAALMVRFRNGPKLGMVEESFAAKLKPGDRFTFAGRTLELVRVHEQTVFVKKTKAQPTTVPRWMGSRMPLSSELADSVRRQLTLARNGRYDSPEMTASRTILETQARRSAIPASHELLVELLKSREGHHLFLYPFEGRLVHEGLASLLAYRISRWKPLTFSMAVNDYGIELLTHEPIDLTVQNLRELFSTTKLIPDVLASINLAEVARRHFREVARVAGLVFQGMPHAGKSVKQLQASASLFYNVFREHDPENMLLVQAHREVLEKQFEDARLEHAVHRMAEAEILLREIERPTPLGFPLLVERIRESLSSEKLADRVRRMAAELDARETE